MNIGFAITARNEKNDFNLLKDEKTLTTMTKDLVVNLRDDGIQADTVSFTVGLVSEKLKETYRKLAGTGVKCNLVCYSTEGYRAITPIDNTAEIDEAVAEDAYGSIRKVLATMGVLVR